MAIFKTFEYTAPESLEQAWTLFQKSDRSVFLAGGTDYLPLLKRGLRAPDQVISLSRISYLKNIEPRPEGLFVGAMQSLSDIAKDKTLAGRFPALAYAASCVASLQIRNRGTLGGNLLQARRCMYFNQSAYWRNSMAPCFKTGGRTCRQVPRASSCRAVYHADLAPVLLALDAAAECFDHNGFSRRPLAEVIHSHVEADGRMQKTNFLLTGILLPDLPPGAFMKFAKHSSRAALDFPVINAALLYVPQSATTSQMKIKLFVGAVAPEPIELSETTQCIRQQLIAGVCKKEQAIKQALAELREKSALIRDTGLAVPARKKAFGIVGQLIKEMDYDRSNT